ncbi:MAG: cardiolipin synthase ClsB [Nevskiales bacterium]|nr:cardiolipin synthase ClsB [Nevskiales bacterium]
MLNTPWQSAHLFELYENGEQFFPAAFAAIASARREVLLETFIWADDDVGRQLLATLVEAARRGVGVDVCVDGYGSANITPAFVSELTAAGGRVHLFDPQPTVLGLRTNLVRRLHRKLLVVDGHRAFVGGINFEVEQLVGHSPASKRDYAIAVVGPVVDEIRAFCRSFCSGAPAAAPARRWWQRWTHRAEASRSTPVPPGTHGMARFVCRDNRRHRTDIETLYRAWLRSATREVILANAYFFPGYRLLRELRRAARRGVRVRLILQGRPDMKSAQLAAGSLYAYLVASGIEVYEYRERPLHAKVAVFDGRWATVGSSNLDPLSLSLNLEANLFVADRDLAQALRGRLCGIIDAACERVPPELARKPRWWWQVYRILIFHLVRRFPQWARSMRARPQRLLTLSGRSDQD